MIMAIQPLFEMIAIAIRIEMFKIYDETLHLDQDIEANSKYDKEQN